ncbi:hypothetical protein DERP_002199 [Dermatophagoides pteronyssinus]|uniref:Uncharacterized protein n=1 Tax=Dermatophagoides pteronyssinus TaxID=6956 RepID=A0ABQ8JH23_DERPT|nr:hypothetical protein DERP_002199 [Dermatophagoides pteronyssinus]
MVNNRRKKQQAIECRLVLGCIRTKQITCFTENRMKNLIFGWMFKLSIYGHRYDQVENKKPHQKN